MKKQGENHALKPSCLFKTKQKHTKVYWKCKKVLTDDDVSICTAVNDKNSMSEIDGNSTNG